MPVGHAKAPPSTISRREVHPKSDDAGLNRPIDLGADADHGSIQLSDKAFCIDGVYCDDFVEMKVVLLQFR